MWKFEVKFPKFVIFSCTFHMAKRSFQRCLINLQVSFPFRIISLQLNWFFVYEEAIIVSLFHFGSIYGDLRGKLKHTI